MARPCPYCGTPNENPRTVCKNPRCGKALDGSNDNNNQSRGIDLDDIDDVSGLFPDSSDVGGD